MAPKRKPTLLSFDEEEDEQGAGEGVEIALKPKAAPKPGKPSSFKRNVAAIQQLESADRNAMLRSSYYSRDSEYTPDRLAQLQSQTKKAAPLSVSFDHLLSQSAPAKTAEDIVVADAVPGDEIERHLEALRGASDAGPSEDPEPALPAYVVNDATAVLAAKRKRELLRRAPQLGMDDSDEEGKAREGEESASPRASDGEDEDMRRIARLEERSKKRRRSAPDFIPLGGPTKKEVAAASRKNESTLVREEDEDDVDADDAGTFGAPPASNKIGFGDPGKEKSGYARQVVDAMEDDQDDLDEETKKEWEQVQLQKRGGKATKRKPDFLDDATSTTAASSKTVVSVVQRVDTALARLRETHTQHETELAETQSQVSVARQQIQGYEEEQYRSTSRYQFFADFQDYLQDLVACFQEKVPRIEEKEDELLQAYRDHRNHLEESRRKQERQDRSDYFDDIGPAMAGAERARRSAMLGDQDVDDDTEAQRPNESDSDSGADGFAGRDPAFYRAASRSRRDKARSQRQTEQLARWKAYSASMGFPPLGIESDAISAVFLHPEDSPKTQLDGVVSALLAQLDEITRQSSEIFDDVLPEFASVLRIRQKFESWRAVYPKEYKEAFASLALQRLLSPFVRVDLLRWRPLFAFPGESELAPPSMPAPVEHQTWHHELFDFGIGSAETTVAAAAEEDDAAVLPKLVEKVVCGHINQLIESGWDVWSMSMSLCLLSVVKDVSVYVEPSTPAYKDLVGAIQRRLESAVSQCYIPLIFSTPNTPTIGGLPQHPLECFVNAVRLLRLIGLWQGVLSPSVLQALVTTVVDERIVPFLESLRQLALPHIPDTIVDFVWRILAAIPSEWRRESPVTPAHLSQLHRFVATVFPATGVQYGDRLKGVFDELRDSLSSKATARKYARS
eukprot:TRINITY_DN10332_c0_g1_i1.p1 TRINITY_DN10332_c0_g1~~TRINITY_DN10332_c0_g1_i1.p1  ORF type:complete len:905 (+),score=190.34 TRINITY_DN10332_c0_g1_i1:2-2716(+)